MTYVDKRDQECTLMKLKDKLLLSDDGRLYFIYSWEYKEKSKKVKRGRRERNRTGVDYDVEVEYTLDKINYKNGENFKTNYIEYK